MKNIEILAPAGSYESMVGAFAAGADAVYMGGQQFGARAFADNPDNQGLLSAIDYAHIHGKKLYLTVNTLQKDRELEEQLYPYLEPLYRQGLDAVIVQDMGVLCAVREWFPGLDIHASTQMTVVSSDHARSLKALGVTRIVPARELNLNEIRHLKEAFSGEIECFVHGALCYCYSGQCLFSSMLGGRSGNRGRCAQPCRLPYRLYEGKEELGSSKEAYLLSPKDICTLELIPDLVEAGIDSFKIEGRMKKPEYAAFVSHVYRKYTDLYLERGRTGYHVDPKDIQALMDLYNRGGFSKGYYRQHNGRNMMSLSRPNHFGSRVGRLCLGTGKSKIFVPDVVIDSGDLLLAEGMADKLAVTVKNPMQPGNRYSLPFKGAKPGANVYRLRNEKLLNDIKMRWLDKKNQEKIYISLTLLKELPAKMQLTCGSFTVFVTGPVAEAARKVALTREVLLEKLKKTGNTPFIADSVNIHMDEDAYLPLTAINQLRREGIEALTQVILDSFRRERPKMQSEGAVLSGGDMCPGQQAHGLSQNPSAQSKPEHLVKTALISDFAMLPAVLEAGSFSEIYLESWLLFKEDFEKKVSMLRKAGVRACLALPYVFRERSQESWGKMAWKIKNSHLSGYLVRNMESLEFIKNFGLLEDGKYMVFDYTVYTMNRRAESYYRNLGALRTTVPVELNYAELCARGCEGNEMVVYGYIPLMICAGCLYKTVRECVSEPRDVRLLDRYGKMFRVKNVCPDCYNLIYNSQPLVLYDLESKLLRLGLGAVRYNFTYESPEQIRRLLSHPGENVVPDFTRGHFNRGVD